MIGRDRGSEILASGIHIFRPPLPPSNIPAVCTRCTCWTNNTVCSMLPSQSIMNSPVLQRTALASPAKANSRARSSSLIRARDLESQTAPEAQVGAVDVSGLALTPCEVLWRMLREGVVSDAEPSVALFCVFPEKRQSSAESLIQGCSGTTGACM